MVSNGHHFPRISNGISNGKNHQFSEPWTNQGSACIKFQGIAPGIKPEALAMLAP
jgi:hypothetical protein